MNNNTSIFSTIFTFQAKNKVNLPTNTSFSNARGFSLIELMIVVAIIGIIVGFAVPTWKESTLKAKRKDAQATLLTGSQYMERFYSARSSYTTVGGNSPTPFNGISNADYSFSLTSTASTYTLTATPNQTDANCGNLTINNAGVKAASGSKGNKYCW